MSIQTLDTQLLLLVNHGFANSLFDILMPALSLQGYLLVTPFLAYFLGSSTKGHDPERKKRLAAAVGAIVIACLAVYASGFVEDWLKTTVGRVRPCRAVDGVRLILPCPNSFSLPSGHAISSFAFATPLFYMARGFVSVSWRSYPLILAALIAFSRIYLGVHYPTDVLTGAVIGGMIGLGLSILYEMIAKRLKQRRQE